MNKLFIKYDEKTKNNHNFSEKIKQTRIGSNSKASQDIKPVGRSSSHQQAGMASGQTNVVKARKQTDAATGIKTIRVR